MGRDDRCHPTLVTGGTGTACARARSCRRRTEIASRQETSHVDDPHPSPRGSGSAGRPDKCRSSKSHPHEPAVLGGFTRLMLVAAWITFLRSEAQA